MVTPDVAALTERIPGLHLTQAAPLRFTDKTYTARATLHGIPVVIKALISSDTYWQQRFAHEVELYRAFTAGPPPFPVPQLHHADDRLLVLAQLPGQPAHHDRHPPPLPAPAVTAMIDALTPMATWTPPASLGHPVDWTARITAEARQGHLDAQDTAQLLALTSRHRYGFAHGDPLPSNALISPGPRAVWIDFEHAGPAPAGADLALLGLVLGRHDPPAEQLCARAAHATGTAASYRAMRLLWIIREKRLHQQLFATTETREVISWLDAQATATLARLRAEHG